MNAKLHLDSLPADLDDHTSNAGITGQVLLVLACYLVMALVIAGVGYVLG